LVRRNDVTVLGLADVQEIRRTGAKEIVDKATGGDIKKPSADADVNANGDINSSDVTLTKSKI